MDDFEQLYDEEWALGSRIRYDFDRERWMELKVLRQRIFLAREARAKRRQELLAQFKQPLLAVSINFPGPHKDVPMGELVHQEVARALESAFDTNHITVRYREGQQTASGPESFWFVDGIDARPLKRMMIDIEEGHPLGRLFDLDVIDVDGTHLERASFGAPPRECLLCNRPAYECLRARNHSLDELIEKASAMVVTYFQGPF